MNRAATSDLRPACAVSVVAEGPRDGTDGDGCPFGCHACARRLRRGMGISEEIFDPIGSSSEAAGLTHVRADNATVEMLPSRAQGRETSAHCRIICVMRPRNVGDSSRPAFGSGIGMPF